MTETLRDRPRLGEAFGEFALALVQFVLALGRSICQEVRNR